VLCGLLLALPQAPAWAQIGAAGTTGAAGSGGQLTNSADIVFRFFRVDGKGPDTCGSDKCTSLTQTDYPFEFSRAGCLCKQAYELHVSLPNDAAKLGSAAAQQGHAELWAGTNCNDVSTTNIARDQRCAVIIQSIPLSAFTQAQSFRLTADQFAIAFNGSTTKVTCPTIASPSIWFLIDEGSNGTYESYASVPIPYDGLPPSPPLMVSSTSGNQAVNLSWEINQSTSGDNYGFQVLCARGYDLAPFAGVFAPAFKTPQNQCGMTAVNNPTTSTGTITTPTNDGGVDGGTVTTVPMATPGGYPPHGPFLDGTADFLKSDYLCSGKLDSTQTSYRVTGLQNDINYQFLVVALDKVGNPSPVSNIIIEAPQLNEDAYTHYRNAGGKASGGFCQVVWGAPARDSVPALFAFAGVLVATRRLLRRRGR
jgi:hypothetical protein